MRGHFTLTQGGYRGSECERKRCTEEEFRGGGVGDVSNSCGCGEFEAWVRGMAVASSASITRSLIKKLEDSKAGGFSESSPSAANSSSHTQGFNGLLKRKNSDPSNHGSLVEELKLAECGKQLRSG
eukprot:757753-Hanusia_phi.AAC.1